MRLIHIVPTHKFAEVQADARKIRGYLFEHGEQPVERIRAGVGLSGQRCKVAMRYLRRDRQIVTVTAPGAGSVYALIEDPDMIQFKKRSLHG